MRTWIVLDCNYLCYRAFFSTGGLSHNTEATGVVYGFLRDISKLSERFDSTDFVFCFDHGKGLREQAYPSYKHSRRVKKLTEEEERALEDMRSQVEKLKKEYLAELGYGNVFYQKGYEADDLMAAVCKALGEDEYAILVTGDQDVYQLLRDNVEVLHPREGKIVTKDTFFLTHGIKPRQWARVKAIAGCKADDVQGVQGVGEITAAKFLRHADLSGKLLNKIEAFIASDQYKINLRLVKLPYEGTKTVELKPDEDPGNKEAWQRLASRLGMKSILNAEPAARSWGHKGFGLKK